MSFFLHLKIYKHFKNGRESETKTLYTVCSNESLQSTVPPKWIMGAAIGTRPSLHSLICACMMSSKVLRYALGFKAEFLSKSLLGTKHIRFSTKPILPVLTLYTKVSFTRCYSVANQGFLKGGSSYQRATEFCKLKG